MNWFRKVRENFNRDSSDLKFDLDIEAHSALVRWGSELDWIKSIRNHIELKSIRTPSNPNVPIKLLNNMSLSVDF